MTKNKQEIDSFIRKIVHKNLKKQYENNAHTYNLRFRQPAATYGAGQRVLKRNLRQSSAGDKYNSKLGPCYVPCVVK